MTVEELIETLQNLPGDPRLRTVVMDVVVSRPYAKDIRREAQVSRVELGRTDCMLSGFLYVE